MCWGRCGASQLLPAPGAIPEPQFPLFLWDFVVTVVTRGTTVWVSWCSPSAHSPSEHSKKEIPDYFISQNSSKTSALSRVGRVTNPSRGAEAPQSQPGWGCWSLYWFCTGSVLVPSTQLPALLQHSQIPNPFFLPRVLRLCRAEVTARRVILPEGFLGFSVWF